MSQVWNFILDPQFSKTQIIAFFNSKRDFNSKEPDFDLHPKAGNCQKTLSSVLNVFDECSISICRKTKLLRCVWVKPRPKLAIDFNGERVNHVFSEKVLKREKYPIISATCFKKHILIQVCAAFVQVLCCYLFYKL